MASRMHFAIDEWYHCFNRGVEKRNIFQHEYDANRFLMLLYAANTNEAVDLFSIRKLKLENILGSHREIPIVAIGAYRLMPNHFHLLLKEISEGGITSFMRKVGTAYTMYFNLKNDRVGHLFSGSFRSRHIGNDLYFQKVVEYIHCNPAELYEPRWKKGKVSDIRKLEQKLVEYPYSSLRGFAPNERHNPIISDQVFEIVDYRSVTRMLADARDYYGEIVKDKFER